MYSGIADDVIGEAKGISSGNTLNWKYKLNLRVKDSTMRLISTTGCFYKTKIF